METDFDYEVFWSGKTKPFLTLSEAIEYAKDMTLEEYGNNRDIAYIRERYSNYIGTTSVRWIDGKMWIFEDIV